MIVYRLAKRRDNAGDYVIRHATNSEKSYFTEDWNDAISTALAIAENEHLTRTDRNDGGINLVRWNGDNNEIKGLVLEYQSRVRLARKLQDDPDRKNIAKRLKDEAWGIKRAVEALGLEFVCIDNEEETFELVEKGTEK